MSNPTVDQMESTSDGKPNTQKNSEVQRLLAQVQKLKKANARLESENASLKKRIKTPTLVSVSDRNQQLALVASRIIRNETGDTGYDLRYRQVNKALEPLITAILPLMKVVEACALSQDVFKRNPELQKDESGKLTDKPVELDGKKQWLPSRLDMALATLEVVTKIPEFGPALQKLHALWDDPKTKEFIKAYARNVANSTPSFERPDLGSKSKDEDKPKR